MVWLTCATRCLVDLLSQSGVQSRLGISYESASMRRFYHGRTETIRPASIKVGTPHSNASAFPARVFGDGTLPSTGGSLGALDSNAITPWLNQGQRASRLMQNLFCSKDGRVCASSTEQPSGTEPKGTARWHKFPPRAITVLMPEVAILPLLPKGDVRVFSFLRELAHMKPPLFDMKPPLFDMKPPLFDRIW